MLIREAPKKAVHALYGTLGPVCSTGYDYVSGAAANGAIIDLESLDHGGVRYRVGTVAATMWSTVGSTAADKKITMSVKLQHGTSPSGGDMADYSTGFIPDARIFNTSDMTTPMSAWSTADFKAGGPLNAWDLRAAKRYIRAVLTPSINDQSTTTATGAGLVGSAAWKRIAASVVLSAPDNFPEGARRGAFSTATASST